MTDISKPYLLCEYSNGLGDITLAKYVDEVGGNLLTAHDVLQTFCEMLAGFSFAKKSISDALTSLSEEYRRNND